MSRVCYFASNKILAEKKNRFVKRYSINGALEKGIKIDLKLFGGIDRDQPDVILWAESEEALDFPSIYISEPYSEAPKSDMKYYAEIEGYPEKDLPGIIEYIHEHMKKDKGGKTQFLELWYIWLGDDQDEIIEKTCSLKDLTEEYLKAILTDDEADYKIVITR